MIHRYLLFGGYTHYPEGGWYDLLASFEELTSATECAASRDEDWWHVIDAESGERVASSE